MLSGSIDQINEALTTKFYNLVAKMLFGLRPNKIVFIKLIIIAFLCVMNKIIIYYTHKNNTNY